MDQSVMAALISQQLLKTVARLVCAKLFLGGRNKHAPAQFKPFAVVGEMFLLHRIGAPVTTLVSHGRIVAGAIEADLEIRATITRLRATRRGAVFIFRTALPAMSCGDVHFFFTSKRDRK